MKGLFKRVCTGKIQRIPKTYSVDLWTVVKQMLNVNPKLRPDCSKLLENPIIKTKSEIYLKKQIAAHYTQSLTHAPFVNELMKTIIFPKNLTHLKGRLPQPRYNDLDVTSEHQPQLTDKLLVKQS